MDINKQDNLYMDIASRVSCESYCTRKKVGSVILTPDGVTLVGYNGTAKGLDNVCELSDNTTNPEVLHSEANAFSKALMAGVSTRGATLYVTLQPCLDCAKIAYQAGIKRVVYRDTYSCSAGTDFLEKVGVDVEKYLTQGVDKQKKCDNIHLNV
jgi:dCMP deaminase